jgi:hypothetical protein
MLSGQPEFTLMPAEHIAEKHNLPLVRHEKTFEELLKSCPRERFFIPDGHCTKEGYGVMAENIAQEILKNLK